MFKYTFTINDNACNPSYSEDLQKEFSLDNNEFFYAETLSGQLTFKGDDYDYIMSRSFNTRFRVKVYLNEAIYFEGYFTRPDCTENHDDRTIKVALTPDNNYDDIVSNLDKEYNIIDLKPVLQSVQIDRRPIVQFYVTNSNVLTCFLGGNSWEQAVTAPVSNESTLINTYRFSKAVDISEVTINHSQGTVNYPQLYGTWLRIGAGYTYYLAGLTGYFMQRVSYDEQYDYLRIHQSSAGPVLYESILFDSHLSTIPDIYFNPVGGGATGELGGFGGDSGVFARIMLGGDPNDGEAIYPVPNNDIVPSNVNYPNIQPYTNPNITLSTNESVEPTEYGRNSAGNYFAPPSGHSVNRYYPVARDRWINTSMWYLPGLNYETLDSNKRIAYVMTDAYDLVSVLNILLKQINDKYYFNEAGSVFFYGTPTIPPMPIHSNGRRIFITQKTNVLKSKYDVSAQKANISLKSILDMLFETHKCKWHMEGNALHIEHLLYYLRGHDYRTTQIGLDLSLWNHPKHFNRYSYGQHISTYDKTDLYKFTEYEYADKVSDAFLGTEIEAAADYAPKGKTEKVSVSHFNPDVDLMLANPTEFSNEGFALFSVESNLTGKTSASWVLPYYTYKHVNTSYIIQNGYLSYFYLAPQYYIYDLSSEVAWINGTFFTDTEVQQTKLMVKQKVWFLNPHDDLYIDPIPYKLIKIADGSIGMVEKMSINLTTRKIEVDLRYGLFDL